MSRTAVGVIVLLIVGCAKPVRLQLSVPQVSVAQAASRLVKGEDPPSPEQCALPCEVTIAPGTTNQVTLEAPGYYPASLEVAYDVVAMSLEGNGKASLVVPLYPRPEPPRDPPETP